MAQCLQQISFMPNRFDVMVDQALFQLETQGSGKSSRKRSRKISLKHFIGLKNRFGHSKELHGQLSIRSANMVQPCNGA